MDCGVVLPQQSLPKGLLVERPSTARGVATTLQRCLAVRAPGAERSAFDRAPGPDIRSRGRDRRIRSATDDREAWRCQPRLNAFASLRLVPRISAIGAPKATRGPCQTCRMQSRLRETRSLR